MHRAWEFLANQDERDELRAIVDSSFSPQDIASPSILGSLEKITKHFSEQNANNLRRREIRAEFEERILDDLLNEDFYGFGYPVEPSPARMPRRIDPAFWENCEVEWDDGKARLDNIFFNRIRIVDPDNYPQFDLSPKRPGPISYVDEINWAIAYHTENDPDFWQLTDILRIKRMRKSINAKNGIDTKTIRGFGDKTFEKYLLEYKKANK